MRNRRHRSSSSVGTRRPRLFFAILALGLGDDPERIALTRSTLTPSASAELTFEVVADVGSASAAFEASDADAMMFLRAGDRLATGALAMIERFAVDDEAALTKACGQVRVLAPNAAGVMARRIEPRLFRAGATLEGDATPWSDDPRIDVEATVLAPAVTAGERIARVTRLQAAHASNPDNVRYNLELGELLASADPMAAAEHANVALEGGDVDGPEGPRLALALGEALFAAGAFEDVLGLVQACSARWAKFTELSFLAFRVARALGRLDDAKSALVQCLESGEDERFPGTVGAGGSLAAYELGLWLEAASDRVSARRFYAAAATDHEPSAIRLRAIDAARAAAPPARLSESGPVATKSCRYGTMSYLANDTFVGRSFDVYGEWCSAEIEILGRFVAEGDVVVDVGANIGSHTVPFAKAVGPSGRVIAVEPQRVVHALLSANAASNGLLHVDCVRAAAGATEGMVRIPEIDPTKPGNVGAAKVVADDVADSSIVVTDVPCIAIDGIGLPSCAVIKIDAEGFEAQVLEGAKATILAHRPVLFVENDTAARSAETLRAIRDLGYEAYWHVVRYYRPDNYFANAEDVFSAFQPQANLVCFPVGDERAMRVRGLVPVSGEDDDFLKAIGRGALTASIAAMPLAEVKPVPAAPALLPVSSAKKPLTIVACIPGREFSGSFFDSWNEFAARCRDIGINLVISRTYDAVVYYARNKVAGGDTRRGPQQAPWGGEVDYDYMLWIDSDVIFRFEDFQALLAHKVEIAAGLYLMADGARYAAVEHMDPEKFRTAGHFEFMTPAGLARRDGLVPVDYCGFGFMLVRRGVFEKLEYPWFRPIWVDMPGGVRDFTSEDVGFCIEAKKAGITVHVDPKVVVGHEKSVILAPNRPNAATRAA